HCPALASASASWPPNTTWATARRRPGAGCCGRESRWNDGSLGGASRTSPTVSYANNFSSGKPYNSGWQPSIATNTDEHDRAGASTTTGGGTSDLADMSWAGLRFYLPLPH